MKSNKENREELVTKALNEYFEPCESFIPGFVSFMTKKDIHLKHYHLTMHPGIFFVREVDKDKKLNVNVYYIRNLEFPEDESGEEEAQGRFDLIAIQGKLLTNRREQVIPLEAIQAYATADYLAEHEGEEVAQEFINGTFNISPIEEDTEVIELTKQDTNRPTVLCEPNTRVWNELESIFEAEKLDVRVSSEKERRSGKEVIVRVELSFPDQTDDSIAISRTINELERQINCCYSSLYEAGNRAFTIPQIWKVFANTTRIPTPKQEEQLEQILDRHRNIDCYINYKQEMRKRKVKKDGSPVDDCTITRHLLPADKIKIKTQNGKVTTGYQFYRKPPLLEHAQATGQLIHYETKELEAGLSEVNRNEINILLARYLLKRTKRKDKTNPKSIQYDTIYKILGKDKETMCRSDKKRIKDNVFKILDGFRKEKVIKNYDEYKSPSDKSKAQTGVKIFV